MKICKVDNCERQVHAKGYCGKHYKQIKRCGKIIDKEYVHYDKCQVEGCNNEARAKGLCNKHYKQNKKFGYIPERTMSDPNKIIKHDDYAEIVLYNRYCEEVARALIDLDDIDKCKNIKWHIFSVRVDIPCAQAFRFLKSKKWRRLLRKFRQTQ